MDKPKKHREPTEEIFSKEYKDKLTISNYKIGVKGGDPVGDMNMDKALQKYLFYSELTTQNNSKKDMSKLPKERLPKPGDDVRPPMPVGPSGMMRERILALSLAPSIVVSKLKGTVC